MEVTGIAGVSIIFTLEVQETSTITKCLGAAACNRSEPNSPGPTQHPLYPSVSVRYVIRHSSSVLNVAHIKTLQITSRATQTALAAMAVCIATQTEPRRYMRGKSGGSNTARLDAPVLKRRTGDARLLRCIVVVWGER